MRPIPPICGGRWRPYGAQPAPPPEPAAPDPVADDFFLHPAACQILCWISDRLLCRPKRCVMFMVGVWPLMYLITVRLFGRLGCSSNTSRPQKSRSWRCTTKSRPFAGKLVYPTSPVAQNRASCRLDVAAAPRVSPTPHRDTSSTAARHRRLIAQKWTYPTKQDGRGARRMRGCVYHPLVER